MKAIVDENLPGRLALWLSERGWEAVHVRDVGLGGQDDDAIWGWASASDAVIVTQDRDFDALAQGSGPRVLRLGIGNATTATLIAWIDQRWERIGDWIRSGERYLDLV